MKSAKLAQYRKPSPPHPLFPTGVGGSRASPQAQPQSLTPNESATYDLAAGVNGLKTKCGDLLTMVPSQYQPKLSHEERRARLKRIADAVRKVKLPDRRDALPGIAREFKVEIPTVRKACETFEVEIPPAETPLSKQSMKIIDLLNKGKKVVDLAERFELTRARIYAIRQQGIDRGLIELEE